VDLGAIRSQTKMAYPMEEAPCSRMGFFTMEQFLKMGVPRGMA
jgi:hypothetical protein